MGELIITGIDDATLERHRKAAELLGKSLEDHVRDMLARPPALSREERLALVKRLQAMTPHGVSQTDSTLLIREDRDSR